MVSSQKTVWPGFTPSRLATPSSAGIVAVWMTRLSWARPRASTFSVKRAWACSGRGCDHWVGRGIGAAEPWRPGEHPADQPGGDQSVDGVAHGVAVDREACGQLVLGRQAFARAVARADVLGDALADLAVDGPLTVALDACHLDVSICAHSCHPGWAPTNELAMEIARRNQRTILAENTCPSDCVQASAAPPIHGCRPPRRRGRVASAGGHPGKAALIVARSGPHHGMVGLAG